MFLRCFAAHIHENSLVKAVTPEQFSIGQCSYVRCIPTEVCVRKTMLFRLLGINSIMHILTRAPHSTPQGQNREGFPPGKKSPREAGGRCPENSRLIQRVITEKM